MLVGLLTVYSSVPRNAGLLKSGSSNLAGFFLPEQTIIRNPLPRSLVGQSPVMNGPDAAADTEDCDPTISCTACEACCCRLEVLLMGDDDVPVELTVEDEWGGWVMRRLDDGWCAALDRATMKCAIYERRPGVCRDYQVGAGDCIVERSRLLVRQPVPGIA